MRTEDKTAFAEAVATFASLYRHEVTKPALRLWWAVLCRFELEDVQRALGVYASSGNRFVAVPGQIAELIEGDPDTRALQAWTRLELAMQRVGRYDSVAFDDALIHACVAEMGGWLEVCGWTLDEAPFRRNEFVKRYRGHQLSRRVPPFPTHLVGLIEADPQSDATSADARRIGDELGVAWVLENGVRPDTVATAMLEASAGEQTIGKLAGDLLAHQTQLGGDNLAER